MTVWCMHLFAGYLRLQITHTHTGCAVPVTFPQQQWLHERASVLRYMYISCLVYHVNVAHLVDYSHAQEVALGSDEWNLSDKVMTLYF